jgi:hypothetical protein
LEKENKANWKAEIQSREFYGCNLGTMLHWVQYGAAKQIKHLKGAEETFKKKENFV